MNATELAAWWGAAIGTLVFLWDIYKWNKTGPVVNVSASPNMKTFGGIEDDNNYILIEVTNTGERKTTITHLIGFHYKSTFKRITRKRNKNFIVGTPAFAKPLPYVLEPGERWMGAIIQKEELEEMSRQGQLYCGIYHSSDKKSVVQRVVIPTEENKI